MVELIEYIKHSGPSAILIIVGLVWGKSIIKYFFDETIELKKFELNQDFEKYKSSIEQQNKNFQHTLDTKLNEFNIRFSELHQERAKVIKKLYLKLVELHSAMYSYTRKGHIIHADAKKEEQERIERVNKALIDYNNYYIPNRIFFSRNIVEKLNNLSKKYHETGFEFSSSKNDLKERIIPKENIKETFDKIKNISDSVETELTSLLEDLENEFRIILGVE